MFLIVVFFCHMFRRRAKITGDINSDDTEEEKEKERVPATFMSFQGPHEGPEGVQSDFKIKEHQIHVVDV